MFWTPFDKDGNHVFLKPLEATSAIILVYYASLILPINQAWLYDPESAKRHDPDTLDLPRTI